MRGNKKIVVKEFIPGVLSLREDNIRAQEIQSSADTRHPEQSCSGQSVENERPDLDWENV